MLAQNPGRKEHLQFQTESIHTRSFALIGVLLGSLSSFMPLGHDAWRPQNANLDKWLCS